MDNNEKKLPCTKPSMLMFQPYKQNVKCFIIVVALVIGLIAAVQLFLWMK